MSEVSVMQPAVAGMTDSSTSSPCPGCHGEVRQGADTYRLSPAKRLAAAISPQPGEVTVAGSLDPWCCEEATGLQIATIRPVARLMLAMVLCVSARQAVSASARQIGKLKTRGSRIFGEIRAHATTDQQSTLINSGDVGRGGRFKNVRKERQMHSLPSPSLPPTFHHIVACVACPNRACKALSMLMFGQSAASNDPQHSKAVLSQAQRQLDRSQSWLILNVCTGLGRELESNLHPVPSSLPRT
ncbi:hypothetical protein DFH09DRAFT_1489420 [Mycena vulgaris]|nr:hypothetical protein DFH09DRAFT_1489420 [Mycena vulgaris]